ncbi:MAG: PEP-CTERM sorting domain-containing protein [Planctomycetes bacterium]|nr:PEP-CTERM sorting domain-containing protein [Planctomycetota bacterium]
MKKTRVLLLAVVAGLMACSAASADIAVYWDPAACLTLFPGGEGELSLYANVPTQEAIVGWGLDLYYNEAVTTVVDIVYGPLWSEVGHDPTAQDVLDGVDYNMAAITVAPPPGTVGVSGVVLLATLTFQGLTPGLTSLVLGAHNPPDLNEGFADDPPPGGFVPWTQTEGCIIVIPEPGTLALLGLGILGLIRRR